MKSLYAANCAMCNSDACFVNHIEEQCVLEGEMKKETYVKRTQPTCRHCMQHILYLYTAIVSSD